MFSKYKKSILSTFLVTALFSQYFYSVSSREVLAEGSLDMSSEAFHTLSPMQAQYSQLTQELEYSKLHHADFVNDFKKLLGQLSNKTELSYAPELQAIGAKADEIQKDFEELSSKLEASLSTEKSRDPEYHINTLKLKYHKIDAAYAENIFKLSNLIITHKLQLPSGFNSYEELKLKSQQRLVETKTKLSQLQVVENQI